jgi:hypothetical protein
MHGEDAAFDLVIPTIGRSSLTTLLRSLDRHVPFPGRLILVDDRRDASDPLAVPLLGPGLRTRLRILRSGGSGPAAARNAGWRAATAVWVAFLDDDVVPSAGWTRALLRDLRDAATDVGGSQGSVTVPLPENRAPTDWERSVASLEIATWITADMAYRREALEQAGGFDERFERAYREDTDLALRVAAVGWRLVRGRRSVLHPVRPADAFVSLRLQRGNADDVLMRALHPGYSDGPMRLGRLRWHAVTACTLVAAALALGAGALPLAEAMVVCWAGLTAALAWRRIAPGPRTPREIVTMIATSAAMPFVACTWWLVGVIRLRRLLADADRSPRPERADAVSNVEATS